MSSETLLLPGRLVELTGTTNLRDMGGYPATHGRRTKWGVMFRSDQLSDVSQADAEEVLMRWLHIRRAYDLRAPAEAGSGLYSIPGVCRRSTPIAAIYVPNCGTAGAPVSRDDVFNIMLDVYRAFVRDHGHIVGGILKDIADMRPTPANAFVVHCTAGTDRTGWTCYLLLSLLGVPEEYAREDFLLTNKVFKQPDGMHKFFGDIELDDETMRVLWTIDERFLDAAVEEMNKLGGLMMYAHIMLGLTNDDIASLRDMLLE